MSVEIDGVNNIIKADTISEVTSANGVAVDGATLKDGTVKASINTSTQTTAAITLDNTVSGGFGASLAWDVHRSDSGNQATAARIYPSRADVWNSDAASDSDLNFQVSQNGTVATRMTVSGTGDVSIADGNVLFQGAGHGVYLGVTSATAANLLNDYEEGDFAVTTTYAQSGSWGLASTSDTLHYIKVGKLVSIQGQLILNAHSSASGIGYINLPFTNSNQTENGEYAVATMHTVNATKNSNTFTAYVQPNLARLYFDTIDATSLDNAALAAWDADTIMNISIVYHST